LLQSRIVCEVAYYGRGRDVRPGCYLCSSMRCEIIRVYDRLFIVFVFQAEDGIRDWSVTGVQTCALPICEACNKSFLLVVLECDNLGGVQPRNCCNSGSLNIYWVRDFAGVRELLCQRN